VTDYLGYTAIIRAERRPRAGVVRIQEKKSHTNLVRVTPCLAGHRSPGLRMIDSRP